MVLAGVTMAAAREAAFYQDLLAALDAGPPATKAELHATKLRLARAHGLGGGPSDSSILARPPEGERGR